LRRGAGAIEKRVITERDVCGKGAGDLYLGPILQDQSSSHIDIVIPADDFDRGVGWTRSIGPHHVEDRFDGFLGYYAFVALVVVVARDDPPTRCLIVVHPQLPGSTEE
jgi:hypothetical protein